MPDTNAILSTTEQLLAILEVRGDKHPCQKCAACCRGGIIEVAIEDALREPKILNRAELLDGRGRLPPEEWNWLLNPGGRCVFLPPNNCCEIYATRPEVCVCFAPGANRCRELRKEEGLPDVR